MRVMSAPLLFDACFPGFLLDRGAAPCSRAPPRPAVLAGAGL